MIQRKFIPGSQWLYFKIYTGVKTADEVLTHTIRPFLWKLYAERRINDSFFIRYNDPDFHIRLRLHIDQFENYAPIFQCFEASFQPLVENGAVIKVLCDTYIREIERYGPDTMELVERLFGIDSSAILELLEKIEGLPTDTRETTRWQLALALLDDTMTAFGKTPDEKKVLFSWMAENFKKEFGFTSHPFTKQINNKYRRYREDIENALSSRDIFTDYEPILQSRKSEIEKVAAAISRIQSSGLKTPTTDELLGSISHMTMNRWFRTNNRQFELVIYDFLTKYFESAIARTKRLAEKQ